MFQDIDPHKLNNQYEPRDARHGDHYIIYHDGKIVMKKEADRFTFPIYEDITSLGLIAESSEVRYLFSVDDTAYYLIFGKLANDDGIFGSYPQINLRHMDPRWLGFAGATAVHLAHWYDSHRYCGKCGGKMQHAEDNRELTCRSCGLTIYPGISPVVIVGLTRGDEILMTRYSEKHSAYRNYALIAGFVEIGETPEDAIRREVMEEVGLEVDNIKYYASQPWAFSDSLLLGYFAEAKGKTDIRLDRDELSEGTWMKRQDIETSDDDISLTWTMIKAFRDNV